MTMHTAGGGWGPPGGQGGYGPPGAPGGYGPPAGPPPGGYGPPAGPPGFGGPPFGAPPYGPPPPKKSNVGLIVGLIAAGVGVVVLALAVVGFLVFRATSAGGGSSPIGSGVVVAVLPAKVSSKAHRHVPAGCELVARLDVAKVIEVPAMKKHLVPVLDDLEANAANDPDGKDFKDFFQKAGIEPKQDMKDAIICLIGLDKPDHQQKFAMIVGGELRPEVVVPAFTSVESPKPAETTFEGRKVATGKDNEGDPIVVGQAGDGAIVFATDRALFESAVKDSGTFQSEYALPTETEASMVLSKAFVQSAMDKGGGPNNPLSRDVAAISRVVGTLTLANPRGEVRITMLTPKDAQRFNQTITGLLLPGFRQQAAREESQAGEIEALKAAKSRVDGSDVVVELPWTAQGVEQAAQKLAQELKKARSKGMSL